MSRSSKPVYLTLISLVLSVVVLVSGLALGEGSSRPDPADLSFYRPPITTAPYPQTSGRRVRNVILLIGDGLGYGQVFLAATHVGGPEGRLHMERLPVMGLIRTHASDSLVTDSAAAGTALAAGIKTRNGMIGMAPDGTAQMSILQAAKAKGMATGLVATSTITHATPAVFAAHVKSRKMEATIAEHLLASRVNVLFGGGRKYFLPRSDPNSGRTDDLDLIAQAKEAGYTYIETAGDLQTLRTPYMLGLFQLDALTTKTPEPSLATLTRRAIRILRQANMDSTDDRYGFFLMIEGSQIDWECHANNVEGTIRQTLLFDEAVEAAVDFALRDGRTLVIVTSDHETGGLTLLEEKGRMRAHWSTKGHSAMPVPLWAVGPGAERFAGTQDNTDIPKKIAQLLDIRPFPRPVK
jgi:alkaline phosphatase